MYIIRSCCATDQPDVRLLLSSHYVIRPRHCSYVRNRLKLCNRIYLRPEVTSTGC